MTALDMAVLEAAVEPVVTGMLRKGCPGDPDDMRQDGYEAALRKARYVDTAKGDAATYLRFPVRGEVSRRVARMLSPVHVSEDQEREAHNLKRVPLDDDEPTDTTPELHVMRAENAARIRAAVEQVLFRFPASLRAAIRLRFGLDGQPPRTPAEVAAETGIPAERVHTATYRFIQAARANAELRDCAF